MSLICDACFLSAAWRFHFLFFAPPGGWTFFFSTPTGVITTTHKDSIIHFISRLLLLFPTTSSYLLSLPWLTSTSFSLPGLFPLVWHLLWLDDTLKRVLLHVSKLESFLFYSLKTFGKGETLSHISYESSYSSKTLYPSSSNSTTAL